MATTKYREHRVPKEPFGWPDIAGVLIVVLFIAAVVFSAWYTITFNGR